MTGPPTTPTTCVRCRRPSGPATSCTLSASAPTWARAAPRRVSSWEALVELEAAATLAELSGYAAFLALAQTNRGEAQFGLGRLDEAIAELEAAKVTYQRMGSHKVAYPLGDLGLVYRERGDQALAKAAYVEAIGFAELSGDLQGLVPALAGLARVLPAMSRTGVAELADRALGYGRAWPGSRPNSPPAGRRWLPASGQASAAAPPRPPPPAPVAIERAWPRR